MRLSERGLALIGEFEGFSPTPYDDPAGHCTVGYGELLHLGPCTPEELARLPITEAQGLAQLAVKAQHYGDAVESMSRLLNQTEYDALTSLCYNIGVGGYARSSVRAEVNSGGNVCAELRRYVKGTNGVTYPGLVRRREAECALFMEPVEEEAMTEDERAAFAAMLAQLGELGKKIDDLARLMALSLPLIATGDLAQLRYILAYLAAVGDK